MEETEINSQNNVINSVTEIHTRDTMPERGGSPRHRLQKGNMGAGKKKNLSKI